MTLSVFKNMKDFKPKSAKVERLENGKYDCEFVSTNIRESQVDGTKFLSIILKVVAASGEGATAVGKTVQHTLNLPDKPNTQQGQIEASKLQNFLTAIVDAEEAKSPESLDKALSIIAENPDALAGKRIGILVDTQVSKSNGREYKKYKYFGV